MGYQLEEIVPEPIKPPTKPHRKFKMIFGDKDDVIGGELYYNDYDKKYNVGYTYSIVSKDGGYYYFGKDFTYFEPWIRDALTHFQMLLNDKCRELNNEE